LSIAVAHVTLVCRFRLVYLAIMRENMTITSCVLSVHKETKESLLSRFLSVFFLHLFQKIISGDRPNTWNRLVTGSCPSCHPANGVTVSSVER